MTDIQRFCTHDGDGIRTTVFLKGCPLACFWCHNPETISARNQIYYTDKFCIGCGRCVSACGNACHCLEPARHTYDADKCMGCGACAYVCNCGAIELAAKPMTADEIVGECLADLAFYSDGGGVTLSGGEPMTFPENCFALLRGLKRVGLNVAVDTCGYFDSIYAPALADLADTILFDIKDTNNKRHIKNTGVSNEKIIHNLRLLDSLGIATIMRCIILNGINDDDDHIMGIADIYRSLSHCRYVELLAYHGMGASKSERLRMRSAGSNDFIPSLEKLMRIKERLSLLGAVVR